MLTEYLGCYAVFAVGMGRRPGRHSTIADYYWNIGGSLCDNNIIPIGYLVSHTVLLCLPTIFHQFNGFPFSLLLLLWRAAPMGMWRAGVFTILYLDRLGRNLALRSALCSPLPMRWPRRWTPLAFVAPWTICWVSYMQNGKFLEDKWVLNPIKTIFRIIWSENCRWRREWHTYCRHRGFGCYDRHLCGWYGMGNKGPEFSDCHHRCGDI